jgi:predicted deacetylase
MKVALRDDDACYFTAPESLERVYHDVWDRVPVCLATVPFAIGYERTGIPREHWHSGKAFPLDQNRELVPFIKDLVARRRATIALHGYTHQDFPDGFEFQAAPDPERRVQEGLRHLHDTLGTPISVFVPPHNALSKQGLDAVSAAGLNLLGSFLSFRPSMRSWDRHTLANWWRVRAYRASTGRRRSDSFVYPYVLRYRRHAEFGCHPLVPGTTVDALIASFEEARRAGGHYCLATHYWEIDATLKNVLRRFLDHVSSVREVRLVPAEALFAA